MMVAWIQHLAASSPQTLGAFAILMQSASLKSAEKQLQSAIWIAGILAMVVFALVLFSPKRKLNESNHLGVDWEKEEARLKSLADLKKATRSPEEQRQVGTAPVTPARMEQEAVPPLPPGAIPGFDTTPAGPAAKPPPTPDAPVRPAGNESEFDKLMRGLSD